MKHILTIIFFLSALPAHGAFLYCQLLTEEYDIADQSIAPLGPEAESGWYTIFAPDVVAYVHVEQLGADEEFESKVSIDFEEDMATAPDPNERYQAPSYSGNVGPNKHLIYYQPLETSSGYLYWLSCQTFREN
jgi:hypothetical protein